MILISELINPQVVCTEEWGEPLLGQIYFVVAHLSLCYVVPLVVVVACYALIFQRVWYRKIPSEVVSSSPDFHLPQRLHQSKLRALRMLAAVVTAFALGWLPLYVTFSRLKFTVVPLSEAEEQFWRTMVPIAQWMSSANSCVNPVLYHFLDPRFRAGFSRILSPGRNNSATPALVRQIPVRRRIKRNSI